MNQKKLKIDTKTEFLYNNMKIKKLKKRQNKYKTKNTLFFNFIFKNK